MRNKLNIFGIVLISSIILVGCPPVTIATPDMSATPTEAPTTDTPSPTAILVPDTPTSLPNETLSPTPLNSGSSEELHISTEGTSRDTYIIQGSKSSEFIIGDKLVVYGEIIPNTEVAIALLIVVAKNPNSLTAQKILIHPSFSVRSNLRVDNNLDNLSESELIPSDESALGYVLQLPIVRLRPNNTVQAGAILQALQPVSQGALQLGLLPFDPPITMRVIAKDDIVASVELIEGNWPPYGTIVNSVIVEPTPLPPTPTSTDTPIPPTPTGTDTPVPPPPTNTDTPVPPLPTNTDTPVPPLPTDTPSQAGGHKGDWVGQTDQGQTILFQVIEDQYPSSYEAVANVSVSFQYDSPCPLGLVTFSSFTSGHMYEPSYQFSLLNIRGSNTSANINGGFKSDTMAEGVLEIHDDRDSVERLNNRCPLISTMRWTATKR